ncbi:MAG: hypothetical protein R3293_20945, partial [Candidatus Promineifilaceae bacterium]|nr:hypothetical protein [Candidatus Promineifilaceae bacterium]
MFKFVGQRITPGYARLTAWFLVAFYVSLATIGLTLQVISGHTYAKINLPVLISVVVVITVWPVTGALIISRHSQHPIGWLLILGIMGAAFDMFSVGYVFYDMYIYSDSLPGLSFPLIFLVWSGFPFLATAVSLMILTFPTGQLPSPAWRKVAIATIIALLLYLPLEAMRPGPVDPSSNIFISNPLSVDNASWAVLEPLLWVASLFLALCNLAAVSSLILRWRRARAEERQQIKWLFLPAAYYCFTIPLIFIAIETGSNLLLNISIALGIPSIAILVIAVAFAIFKYRLYDVDIIINRTLVYGTLTACVAGLYMLVVGSASLLLQSNVQLAGLLITGLLTSVLYRPVRAFLQQRVDRLTYGRAGAPPAPSEEMRSIQEV